MKARDMQQNAQHFLATFFLYFSVRAPTLTFCSVNPTVTVTHFPQKLFFPRYFSCESTTNSWNFPSISLGCTNMINICGILCSSYCNPQLIGTYADILLTLRPFTVFLFLGFYFGHKSLKSAALYQLAYPSICLCFPRFFLLSLPFPLCDIWQLKILLPLLSLIYLKSQQSVCIWNRRRFIVSQNKIRKKEEKQIWLPRCQVLVPL